MRLAVPIFLQSFQVSGGINRYESLEVAGIFSPLTRQLRRTTLLCGLGQLLRDRQGRQHRRRRLELLSTQFPAQTPAAVNHSP
jgi:hypothetical protein